MNNFKSGGPGGLRKRPEFIGGRPKSDANYGAKKSFDKKPFGGDRGGDRGGSRGGFGGGARGGDRGGFGGGDRGGDRRPVEMHKATCSTCGKPCEVPFRPDGSKPVLCSECFGKNRSDDRNGVERRGFSNDRPQRTPDRKFDAPAAPRSPSPDMKALQQQVSTLEAKLNEVLYILKGSSPVKKAAKFEKVVIPAGEVVTVVSDIKKAPKVAAPKKEAAPKAVAKKAPVKKVAAKKAAPKKVAKKTAKK